jgi:LysM repeat protein
MRALALAFVLLAVPAVPAADKVHVVTAGESAPALAKKYYGDSSLSDLLLRYNGKTGKMIHPGERLSIPYCEVYRTRSGDTWSELAEKHLGRGTAAPTLAELNGYATDQPLRVGARIVVPVVLKHTLARGESLSSLAQRFYGDPAKAATLQAFGRIEDAKRLAVGTPLEIPLIAFVRAEKTQTVDAKKPIAVAAPTPAKPAETATAAAVPDPPVAVAASATPGSQAAPPPPAAEVAPRFVGPLDAAGRSFASGEYDRAREILESLRAIVASEGTEADRRNWGRLLAFVYIALDRDADACAVYRAGSPASGPTALDPDLVSPRIRDVLLKCSTRAESAERLGRPGAPAQIPPRAGTRG